jgi:hypothetical protein
MSNPNKKDRVVNKEKQQAWDSMTVSERKVALAKDVIKHINSMRVDAGCAYISSLINGQKPTSGSFLTSSQLLRGCLIV